MLGDRISMLRTGASRRDVAWANDQQEPLDALAYIFGHGPAALLPQCSRSITLVRI
jgi:hypothetical protein